MAEAWFDPQGEVTGQGEWEENVAASDDDLEAALRDLYRWLRRDGSEVRPHDRDGWFADWAGSEKCLALGHERQDDYPEWDEDTHNIGFDGDWLCESTRYGTCCTYCESEDCGATRRDVNIWRAPWVTGGARG